MIPKQWEIWWAWFMFEDSAEKKRRPVLVLDPKRYIVLCFKITSHEARDLYGEYEIIHWQSSGLPKPSTVRLTQLQEISYQSFDRKIGELHPEDVLYISRYI